MNAGQMIVTNGNASWVQAPSCFLLAINITTTLKLYLKLLFATFATILICQILSIFHAQDSARRFLPNLHKILSRVTAAFSVWTNCNLSVNCMYPK